MIKQLQILHLRNGIGGGLRGWEASEMLWAQAHIDKYMYTLHTNLLFKHRRNNYRHATWLVVSCFIELSTTCHPRIIHLKYSWSPHLSTTGFFFSAQAWPQEYPVKRVAASMCTTNKLYCEIACQPIGFYCTFSLRHNSNTEGRGKRNPLTESAIVRRLPCWHSGLSPILWIVFDKVRNPWH